MVTSRENLKESFTNHNLKLEKIMKCCRVCLDHDDKDMNYIFQNKIDCDVISIRDRLIYCTGLEIDENDGLPPRICGACYNNLENAYHFKMRFLETDKTLKRLLCESECNVKLESVDLKVDDVSNLSEDDNFDCDNNLNVDDLKDESQESRISINNEKITKDGEKKAVEENCVSGVQKARILKMPLSSINCKKKSKLIQCKVCKLLLNTRAEAKEHRKTHQKNVMWMCEICGKVFRHRASHITHLRSHRPPMFSCDQCDYRTSHKHDLTKHIRIHSDVKHYQCSYCPASFHVVSNLRSHERRTHQKVRDHTCPVCSRLFFDTAHLRRHIDSHNEVKRFTCEICGSAYSRRCYWVRHMERQHEQSVKKIRPGRQKTNFVIGEGEVKRQKTEETAVY